MNENQKNESFFSSLIVLNNNLKTSLFNESFSDVSVNVFRSLLPKFVGLYIESRILKQSSSSYLRSIKYCKYCSSFWKWWACKNDNDDLRFPLGIDLSIFKSCKGFSFCSIASMIYSPCLRSSYRVLSSFAANLWTAYSSIITFSIFLSSWSEAMVWLLLCFHTLNPPSSPPAKMWSPDSVTARALT